MLIITRIKGLIGRFVLNNNRIVANVIEIIKNFFILNFKPNSKKITNVISIFSNNAYKIRKKEIFSNIIHPFAINYSLFTILYNPIYL